MYTQCMIKNTKSQDTLARNTNSSRLANFVLLGTRQQNAETNVVYEAGLGFSELDHD